jgi:hypothetical protein
MKIKPISSWQNGQEIEGNTFMLRLSSDNLSTEATFYYCITTEQTENTLGQMVTDGNLTLNGADYQSWDADPSANAWAINWALAKLNLELLPE